MLATIKAIVGYSKKNVTLGNNTDFSTKVVKTGWKNKCAAIIGAWMRWDQGEMERLIGKFLNVIKDEKIFFAEYFSTANDFSFEKYLHQPSKVPGEQRDGYYGGGAQPEDCVHW